MPRKAKGDHSGEMRRLTAAAKSAKKKKFERESFRQGYDPYYSRRATAQDDSPYKTTHVVYDENNNRLGIKSVRTPRRSRSTDSVGRARQSEARNRGKSKKPAIDFGNR